MPHHARVTVSGVISDVFAHRFVIETEEGRMLADLTPKGAERVHPEKGARVTISGERKPSEIKVDSFALEGGETVELGHKPDEAEDEADPQNALRGAEAAGYTVVGPPRRKPRHFEVLGRDRDGKLLELHMEFDGSLRKSKDADPEKWGEHASAAPVRTDEDAKRL